MTNADVIVVGAGLSGLRAAGRLLDHGLSVSVLEARDRVGGRTQTEDIRGAKFDLGGQWLGPNQDRMYALVEQLGLQMFRTHTAGKKVLEVGDKISTYSSSIPSLNFLRLIELQRSLNRVDRERRKIPIESPYDTGEANALDGQTVETFKLAHTKSTEVRQLFDVAVRTVFGADPAEISLLYFLFYLNSGGGLMSLVEIENGAQRDRFVDGAQAVSIKLAARLGDAVHLEQPVRIIEHHDRGVRMHTDTGVFSARYAIVAIPPLLAGRIRYTPELPSRRDQLTQRYGMGATTKAMAIYDTPFWREAGFSGEVVTNGKPISCVFDNTSHDGAVPALLSFIVGRPAREWASRPADERRAEVLAALARFFGPQAKTPVHYEEKDWCDEEWTRGCPVGIAPPGIMADLGRELRTPIGRIHWAGTETASEWCGYMEGALQAGDRAATEIIEGLSVL